MRWWSKEVAELLVTVSQLPRFDLVALLMGDDEKAALSALLSSLSPSVPSYAQCLAIFQPLL